MGLEAAQPLAPGEPLAVRNAESWVHPGSAEAEPPSTQDPWVITGAPSYSRTGLGLLVGRLARGAARAHPALPAAPDRGSPGRCADPAPVRRAAGQQQQRAWLRLPTLAVLIGYKQEKF